LALVTIWRHTVSAGSAPVSAVASRLTPIGKTAERVLGERDVLLTVAEIATAFAGFATLAAVFTGRSEHDRNEEEFSALFRTLLLYSLVTVGLCFAPFVPQWYGTSAQSSWYFSSWILGFTIAGVNLWLFRRNRAGYAQLHWLTPTLWGALAWSPVLFAGLAIGGIGSAAGNYLVALLITLSLSAAAFVRVIASSLAGSRGS